jgi:hypothetical protein
MEAGTVAGTDSGIRAGSIPSGAFQACNPCEDAGRQLGTETSADDTDVISSKADLGPLTEAVIGSKFIADAGSTVVPAGIVLPKNVITDAEADPGNDLVLDPRSDPSAATINADKDPGRLPGMAVGMDTCRSLVRTVAGTRAGTEAGALAESGLGATSKTAAVAGALRETLPGANPGPLSVVPVARSLPSEVGIMRETEEEMVALLLAVAGN